MNISAFFLSLLFVSASADLGIQPEMNDIKADSPLGQRLLSEARQLADVNNMFDNTWVSGFSIKFEGCHQISQWNDEADDEEDVRIVTKRLVRFRLCPSSFCSSGCSTGYGDYIIDMNTFLAAWFEAKQTYQSFKCDYLQSYVCYCDDAEDQDTCLWDCYNSHNMAGICMQENPYSGEAVEVFDFDTYMTCAQTGFANDGRALAEDYSWDGNFYIGPYCAKQGGAIYMGLFTDDSCTSFADSNGGKETYYSITGSNLPYGQTNIVDMECMSCKEPKDNNNDGNDAEDSDDVTEACETIYTIAGKCEANLPYGTVYSPNNNGCNYMQGIKIVRKDGTVVTAEAKANKTASVFIGIFTVAFVLLSAYVYYLKTKLDRASINLSE